MPKPGSLTPEEMNKAVRLAADMYEQETEQKSMMAATEEVGVPPEYMARAMARVYAERHLKKSAGKIWIQAAVVVICFAAVYWSAKSITRQERSPVPTPGVATPLDLSQIPTSVSQVPVEPGDGVNLAIRGMNQLYPTTITFHNGARMPVQIYQLDSQGVRHFVATLQNPGDLTENTWFTHPWLITAPYQESIVYPAWKPCQVDIHSAVGIPDGYSLPLLDLDAHPVYAASRGLPTAIEIVNACGESAQLYRVSLNGKREHIGTLADGEGIFEPTWENERWVAINSIVHDTFKPGLNPTTALIESGDIYITNPPPIPPMRPMPNPNFPSQ